MKSRKIIIPAIALAILSLVTVLGVRSVRADENSTYPSIVQKLVERFNLNTEEVQQVFTEAREERQQEMQARFEERLDKAVSEGKISQKQKEAIIAKKEEMRGSRGELKDLSPEERRAKMQVHKEEMQAWAEANDIDLSQMRSLLGGGHRGGFGGSKLGK